MTLGQDHSYTGSFIVGIDDEDNIGGNYNGFAVVKPGSSPFVGSDPEPAYRVEDLSGNKVDRLLESKVEEEFGHKLQEDDLEEN